MAVKLTQTKSETATEEIDVTPAFCFARAAEALLQGQPMLRDPTGNYMSPPAEWRELGTAIALYGEWPNVSVSHGD